MVEEYPEDFFGDVDDVFAPDPIGAWDIHGGDESWWPGFFGWGWITEVGKDLQSPGWSWTSG